MSDKSDTREEPWCATHSCPLAICPHCSDLAVQIRELAGGVAKHKRNICEHGVSLKTLCAECGIAA